MDVNAINPDRIDEELERNGYLIVKDPEIERMCVAARTEYDRSLRETELHPTRQKFHYRSLASGPWRKLAIGSTNGIGNPYAQNLQSTYFDAGDQKYPALGALFRMLVGVRNRLMRVDPSFGSEPERDGFWNACRIHHYPRGGGFMAMHKDTHFPQVIDAQIGKPFYQVSVLLSRKSSDFMSGGGVVYDNQEKKIDVETAGGFGSLVLFDGRTYHGVEDVDLDQLIDFSRPDGRLAAFVNLYSAN